MTTSGLPAEAFQDLFRFEPVGIDNADLVPW